jgi:predicted metal-dependent hydrolase
MKKKSTLSKNAAQVFTCAFFLSQKLQNVWFLYLNDLRLFFISSHLTIINVVMGEGHLSGYWKGVNGYLSGEYSGHMSGLNFTYL